MQLGIVAIGRNEGERLRRCLTAATGSGHRVVYVDSGSSDGSQALAVALGAELVELDVSVPFTAARARNAGYARLRELEPGLDAVQFLDGDCELRPGWLAAGLEALRQEPRAAVVFGRRRERYPEASVYNALMDIEWAVPPGLVEACHGDAMMRCQAFDAAGGFDPSLIAGEEPELCVRLRELGFLVRCLDVEMTLHDADMHRFQQFWRRARRAGHAYAEGAWLHGSGPSRHWVRETASIVAWGVALPAGAVVAAPLTLGVSLGLASAAYGALGLRVFARQRRGGRAPRLAAAYAGSVVAAKLAHAQGLLDFTWSRLRGRRLPIIEYKAPTSAREADSASTRA